MKVLTIVLVTVITHIQSMSDDQRELLKKWHMECFEETKVSPDLVLKLKAGDWRLNNKLLKKWTLCVLNKYDLMTNQGVFRLDNALSLVPDKGSDSNENVKKERKKKSYDEEENAELHMALFLASFFMFLR